MFHLDLLDLEVPRYFSFEVKKQFCIFQVLGV